MLFLKTRLIIKRFLVITTFSAPAITRKALSTSKRFHVNSAHSKYSGGNDMRNEI